MPSIAKSSLWFVRITAPHAFLLPKLKEFSNQIDCKRMLAMLHIGDSKENPHCHFTIEMTSTLQKQSFDVRLKKHFDITAKTEYSSKVWDGTDQPNIYMYHEEGDAVVAKGYSSLELDTFKKSSQIITKQVEYTKEKSSNKLLDKLMADINSDTTLQEIVELALDKIHSSETYHPGDFRLKAICTDAYIKSRRKEDWGKLKTQIAAYIVFDLKTYS